LFRIDFRSCEQVVKSANAIPCAPRAEKLADKELLIPDPVMLAAANAVTRLEFVGEVLQAFTLANRIEYQNDVALPNKTLAERLIKVAGLAVVPVRR